MYDHLIGKKIRAVEEFNGDDRTGILSKKKIDWQCDAKGEDIYVLTEDNGRSWFLYPPNDVITEVK